MASLVVLEHTLMKWLFRMTTLKQILSQECTRDWLFSMDLKDVYFHIQITPHHIRFLRFTLERVAYQYTFSHSGCPWLPIL